MCCTLRALQNWLSHGYYYDDPDADEWAHHLYMFLYVTVPTAFFLLFVFYYPDHQSVHMTTSRSLSVLIARNSTGYFIHSVM